METIKVNMSPNPLDVQTIHASQNDGEARQWGFELHNNGDVIDSSEVTDQMVFKAYKGGTEQLLSENTSTPTTSPFKGDIKYPQGLLADQEFTYRQSPTESDGLAKITDIKGNTLVWNQLQPNSISRTNNGVTYTYDNGKLTVTGTATSTSWWLYGGLPTMSMKANHKYLLMFGKGMEGASLTTFNWYLPNTFQRFYTDAIITINSDSDQYIQLQVSEGYTIDTVLYPQVFDLTLIFGSGNEPTSVEEFRSLFPLDYYPYNSGSLIAFNGNGLKTVGRNLFVPYVSGTTRTQNGITGVANADGTLTFTGTSTGIFWGIGDSPVFTLLKGTYTMSQTGGTNIRTVLVDRSKNLPIINIYGGSPGTFTLSKDTEVHLYNYIASGTTVNDTIKVMLQFGRTVTEYEPYSTQTTNLPIATYFPNGMKSAGSVYDELTESKAITRVGMMDLGSLEWEPGGTNTQDILRMKSTSLRNVISKTSSVTVSANVVCINYATVSAYDTYIKTAGISVDSVGDILIYDPNYNTSTSAGAFKTAMNGVYLYYELATPTETSFTTASLVTENAEIPLSNEDGTLIGKCTEELSAEPGFHDAKIKLSDSDGECYSNKIQLHVERSPQ